MAILGYVDSFESFGLVDGPGVRSIVFLAGCPFRCLYCHNPETWEVKGKQQLTAKEVYDKLSRYKPYWQNNGGITISGGEPLLQLDFIIELANLAKADNVSVVVDTAGGCFNNSPEFLRKLDDLLANISLIMLDIKAITPSIHKKITGAENSNVLAMFSYLNDKKFPIWVRHVLVPDLTDFDTELSKISFFLKQFTNISKVEVLPYHALMIPKYQKLGINYPLLDTLPPTEGRIINAKEILNAK